MKPPREATAEAGNVTVHHLLLPFFGTLAEMVFFNYSS
jgi:hypothetical protein